MRYCFNNIFYALLVLLFFSYKSNAQESYNSKFYLIDSIDLNLVSEKEKKFITNTLQEYHNTTNDSLQLSKLKEVVEEVKSAAIWSKYNEYMLQKSDSLLINSQNSYYEFIKFDALYNKAYYFKEKKEYTQAEEYFKKSIKQGQKTDNRRLLAKSYVQLGRTNQFFKQYPKALNHFKTALGIQQELGNKIDISNTYNVIANLYDSQDNHAEALKYYFKSLKIGESLKDKRRISASLNRIATLYKKQNEFESAFNYYQKSLALKREIKDKRGEATLLNNIGVFYKEQGEYHKALEYYEKSLSIKKTQSRKRSIAHTLNNIGTIKRYLKNYDEALSYYQESLAISVEKGDEKWEVVTLFNMAEVYLEKGMLRKAKETAVKSVDLAQKMEKPGLIRDAAKVLKEVYKKENKWKEAYTTNELYIKLRDSIRNDKTEKTAIKLKANYDLANKEQEIALLSSKNEVLKKDQEVKQLKIDRNKYSLLFFSIALAFALGLAFYAYRISQKRRVINSLLKREKAIISEQRDAKNMMLQEIHHRVKNNLQVVNSLLRMQSSKMVDESVVAMFKETQSRVRSMAKLHEKMYESGDLENLDAKEHITMLIKGIVENYSLGTRIKLDLDIESLSIDAQTMMPLSLIINEMITNSLKYAFKDRDEGIITVKLNQSGKSNELLISDNGIGYINNNVESGLGTKLINSFTNQLKGELERLSQSGTQYKLTFPKN